jgi:hypothetical protein
VPTVAYPDELRCLLGHGPREFHERDRLRDRRAIDLSK